MAAVPASGAELGGPWSGLRFMLGPWRWMLMPSARRSVPLALRSYSLRGPARRLSGAFVQQLRNEPDLYQVMYGLGGVHVPTADTMAEGQAVGDVLTALLRAGGDERAGEHVIQLWATAHGLVALLAVGRVDVDPASLHGLLDTAVNDVLSRTLPGSDRRGDGDRRPRPAPR
jgi:hypothetical protein